MEALWRVAQGLARRNASRHPGAPRLPPLLFFTDPARTPDPVGVAQALPPGAGVVFRHFGAEDAETVAMALAEVARARRLVLLIGDDERLAARIGAHGLHLPQRRLGDGPRLRARHRRWLLTGAAHSASALATAARADLDGAVLSPVFPSASPSAGGHLGPARTASLIQRSGSPVYALGGVDIRTARQLRMTGACGIAAVSGLTSQPPNAA